MSLAAFLMVAVSDLTLAAGRGTGGGGRGGHGAHGGHGGHGHGGHGYYGYGRVGVGIGFYGGYWPYYGYGYPYYYPSAYYYPSTYYATPYYEQPVYVQQDPTAPRYVEPAPQANAPQSAPGAYWYFCPDSRQYYPYVQNCASSWQRVPPQPPPSR